MEDELSEQLLRRLFKERPVRFEVDKVYGNEGCGYLKRQSPAFNNAAKVCPFLLLTDLDSRHCAPELLKEWLPKPRHKHFLLRVAVREVEAWVLASASDDAFGRFLGLKSKCRFPRPEDLQDPKGELLRLAIKCNRRERREALVRKDHHGNPRQGRAYNATLSSFIWEGGWAPQHAAQKCPQSGEATESSGGPREGLENPFTERS